MSRMDRYRMKNKYASGLDALSGDAETTQLATSGVAELLKNIGSVAASAQAKKETAAKAEALNAANLELLNAKAAQAKVNADPKATAEQKQKAQDAVDKAQAKLASLMPVTAASAAADQGGGKKSKPESKSYFTVQNVAIGLGVLVAGVVGYKLITRHSAPPSRGSRGGR